jgi:hypothetical protein
MHPWKNWSHPILTSCALKALQIYFCIGSSGPFHSSGSAGPLRASQLSMLLPCKPNESGCQAGGVCMRISFCWNITRADVRVAHRASQVHVRQVKHRPSTRLSRVCRHCLVGMRSLVYLEIWMSPHSMDGDVFLDVSYSLPFHCYAMASTLACFEFRTV